MTATEGRLWTLKEIIDYCKEEQGKCEETQDHWTIIGNTSAHCFPLETEVVKEGEKMKSSKGGYYWKCWAHQEFWFVNERDLENRKHLDTDRYNAFQSVIDKCNELMNSIKQ